MKMWAGRTSGEIDDCVNTLNASIGFDKRMYAQDIAGSIAHAAMLGKVGIITQAESEQIGAALAQIADDIASGALKIDETAEDIHMFVEAELTKRLGDTGKRLHTARSRNDQVALDFKMYLKDEAAEMKSITAELVRTLYTLSLIHI